jgi:hypothetical protein
VSVYSNYGFLEWAVTVLGGYLGGDAGTVEGVAEIA